MTRNEHDRLQDISEAIVAIREHLTRTGKVPRDEDAALLRDALLFQFVVIGEAVKSLAPETRESEPDAPWAAIAGVRDLVTHEYFRIETNQVLAIVERYLSALDQAVDRLLSGRPAVPVRGLASLRLSGRPPPERR